MTLDEWLLHVYRNESADMANSHMRTISRYWRDSEAINFPVVSSLSAINISDIGTIPEDPSFSSFTLYKEDYKKANDMLWHIYLRKTRE